MPGHVWVSLRLVFQIQLTLRLPVRRGQPRSCRPLLWVGTHSWLQLWSSSQHQSEGCLTEPHWSTEVVFKPTSHLHSSRAQCLLQPSSHDSLGWQPKSTQLHFANGIYLRHGLTCLLIYGFKGTVEVAVTNLVSKAGRFILPALIWTAGSHRTRFMPTV